MGNAGGNIPTAAAAGPPSTSTAAIFKALLIKYADQAKEVRSIDRRCSEALRTSLEMVMLVFPRYAAQLCARRGGPPGCPDAPMGAESIFKPVLVTALHAHADLLLQASRQPKWARDSDKLAGAEEYLMGIVDAYVATCMAER